MNAPLNKVIRDILISANPLITGVATVLIKATNDQSFTSASMWILGGAFVSGLFGMYLHFITNAPQAVVTTQVTPSVSVSETVPAEEAPTTGGA